MASIKLEMTKNVQLEIYLLSVKGLKNTVVKWTMDMPLNKLSVTWNYKLIEKCVWSWLLKDWNILCLACKEEGEGRETDGKMCQGYILSNGNSNDWSNPAFSTLLHSWNR